MSGRDLPAVHRTIAQRHRTDPALLGQLHPRAALHAGLLRERRSIGMPGPMRQLQQWRPAGQWLPAHPQPSAAGTRSRVNTQQLTQALITLMPGLTAGPAPDRLRLVKHLGNGGSRKDVVELLKQQGTPIAANGQATCESKKRSHCVALPQQTLQAAVVTFLIRTAGGTAAMQLEVELIPPDRQLPCHGLKPVEVLAQ